jgi:hypothetical protein
VVGTEYLEEEMGRTLQMSSQSEGRGAGALGGRILEVVRPLLGTTGVILLAANGLHADGAAGNKETVDVLRRLPVSPVRCVVARDISHLSAFCERRGPLLREFMLDEAAGLLAFIEQGSAKAAGVRLDRPVVFYQLAGWPRSEGVKFLVLLPVNDAKRCLGRMGEFVKESGRFIRVSEGLPIVVRDSYFPEDRAVAYSVGDSLVAVAYSQGNGAVGNPAGVIASFLSPRDSSFVEGFAVVELMKLIPEDWVLLVIYTKPVGRLIYQSPLERKAALCFSEAPGEELTSYVYYRYDSSWHYQKRRTRGWSSGTCQRE